MKIVCLLSGGMDSATLLHYLINEGNEVYPLMVDYGQKHKKELDYAKKLCAYFKIGYEVADLTGITKLISNSSQTSEKIEVPEGHYAEESMKLTVVPNRNMIMLSVAAGYAINVGAKGVAYAAHTGDHAVYPDCRQEFVDALKAAIRICDYEPLVLKAPFVELDMSKTDICKMGATLGTPYELTWSCYKGVEKHCGLCGTCNERKEAFRDSDTPDPTEYEQ